MLDSEPPTNQPAPLMRTEVRGRPAILIPVLPQVDYNLESIHTFSMLRDQLPNQSFPDNLSGGPGAAVSSRSGGPCSGSIAARHFLKTPSAVQSTCAAANLQSLARSKLSEPHNLPAQRTPPPGSQRIPDGLKYIPPATQRIYKKRLNAPHNPFALIRLCMKYVLIK